MFALNCWLTSAAFSHAAPLKLPEKGPPSYFSLHRSIIIPALKTFVNTPGTTSDSNFVMVEKTKKGEVTFTKLPKGWSMERMDEKSLDPGPRLLLDMDGFRAIIKLQPIADVSKSLLDRIAGDRHENIVLLDQIFINGRQVTRLVMRSRLKYTFAFIEYRYFITENGAICAELAVFEKGQHDERTLDELLTFLRSQYGKYEGVCEQTDSLVAPKK
jgi:hypothetical protein